ncbi:hypothetical protein NPIL_532331 [Nephila pilipes]|uniref:Uncharacterized protein n=1 Tax=Nephila pilipes TaxID=299642 RepID=A0A8X6UHZ1_NEPPI|nr:hypothetical protein NPIL_532331 [Nephila pilipes]
MARGLRSFLATSFYFVACECCILRLLVAVWVNSKGNECEGQGEGAILVLFSREIKSQIVRRGRINTTLELYSRDASLVAGFELLPSDHLIGSLQLGLIYGALFFSPPDELKIKLKPVATGL